MNPQRRNAQTAPPAATQELDDTEAGTTWETVRIGEAPCLSTELEMQIRNNRLIIVEEMY